MKITALKDKEKADAIRKSIKENDGYCPCALEKSPDTKCMCKDFRDQIEQRIEGKCHCGLYEVVIKDGE